MKRSSMSSVSVYTPKCSPFTITYAYAERGAGTPASRNISYDSRSRMCVSSPCIDCKLSRFSPWNRPSGSYSLNFSLYERRGQVCRPCASKQARSAPKNPLYRTPIPSCRSPSITTVPLTYSSTVGSARSRAAASSGRMIS